MALGNKKVIACLISRMKSTRLKEKALIDLNGLTMTEQIIKRLKLSKYIDQIVLATSTNPQDQILIENCIKWGITTYAGHERDVLDRLIKISEIYQGDLIIRVTGDNPFTDHYYIDQMIEIHGQNNADYTRTNRLPLGVTAEIHTKEMLPKLKNLIPDPNHSGYLSFFSFNPEYFNCYVLLPPHEHSRPFYSLTVDYKEDIELARKIYKSTKQKNQIPTLSEAIEYLDNSDIDYHINENTEIKLPDDKTMNYGDLIRMLDEKAKKSNIVNILK